MERRLSVACLSATILLVACGDPASLDPGVAAARKYDQALSNARKVLAEVAVADSAGNRTSAEALRAAASACTPPSGATSGQQAAFALTAAELLREAARLDTVAIEQVQARQRAAADQVVSALHGAKSLRQLQGAMPSSDESQAETLRKAMDEVNTLASDSETQAQTARSTADAKKAEAAEQAQKATDLQSQAAEKRKAAAAARTAAEAQALTQEAAALTTQAIEARAAAAAAEIVVRNLAPEADRLQKRAEAFRAQIARLQADREALDAVTAARGKANTALSDASRAALQKATAAADALEKASSELRSMTAATAESLETAANQAQRGGSLPGPANSTAKMTAASVHLAQAMLQERIAGGAAMEASAFDAMATASGDAKWSKLAASSREERTAAMAKALTALEAADADLGGDTAASLASLRARVADLRKSLEGPKQDKTEAATSGGAAAESSDKPADATATPPETPADAPAAQPSSDAPAQPAAEPAPGR